MIDLKEKTVYYLKFNNGEEVVGEIFHVMYNNRIEGYTIVNPMLIRVIPIKESTKLMALPLLDTMLVDDNEFSFNPDHVMFATDKISENLLEIYDGFVAHLNEPIDEDDTKFTFEGEGPEFDTSMEEMLKMMEAMGVDGKKKLN